jgi:hypothetical protein
VKSQRQPVFYATVATLFALLISSLPPVGAAGAAGAPSATATGGIAGTVRVDRPVKRPKPLPVNKNRDVCGDTVPDESLLVEKDGGLSNAVVILSRPDIVTLARPAGRLVLNNKNCTFVPRVQVAPLGSDIWLLNSDPILHDVHARIGSETLFNEGLPPWRRVKRRLDRAGIVSVECEVLHTWQRATIVVTRSPFFSVSDPKGRFLISEVPPGKYELELWHERLGRQNRPVDIKPGMTESVDLVLACLFC